MLNQIAELSKNGLRHVGRILGDETDADALRADEADNMLDRAQKVFRRIVEQKMRFVEKENQLCLVEVANLGQFLEQFGQHPQKENRVKARRTHQFSGAKNGAKNMDDSAPIAAGAQKIVYVELWFAEKIFRALIFEDQQAALDRADRRGRHVPVGLGYFRRRVAEMLQQRPKILEIDEQQTLFVGELEGDIENPLLDIVEFEHAGQEQGPQIRYSGADRMPGLPLEIPKCDRKIVRRIGDPDILRPLHKVRLRVSGHRDPGEIAFDIGGDYRGPRARKPFRENLQGYGLAGAGGARDESVAVAKRKSQILV